MPPYQSNFERLRTTLMGGKADRVPLMELAIDRKIMGEFLKRPIQSPLDLVDFAWQAGYDYVKLSPQIEFNPDHVQPREGLRQTSATPSDLARSWHSEGQGIITTIEDFEKFRWPQLNEVSYQAFEEIQSGLPPELKIIGQYGDIFTWVWHFMGFETFSFALIENPALVRLLFDKIGAIELELFKTMADFPNLGALFYSDDIAFGSSLFMSPQVFRTYLFPWMQQIAAICRAKQIPFIYHTDGKIWDVMDDLHQIGVNALQPLEPQAIDIRQVKKEYGHKFCLIGNVDVDLLSRGTPTEVTEVARGLIKEIGVNGGYCLGSGNTVPAYVPYENFYAMLTAGWKYGGYE
ncbi:nucleoside 2-deoxyribosyltransferase [candidate division KSB1 bacterium]|nr:nucleoside 2-deoxyribosyltransferase [candidate division KSB1 bacterium]